MQAKPLLNHILADDALTRGLGDAEARVLVEWLVEQAERTAVTVSDDTALQAAVGRLCRRGRSISRFVLLWCHRGERGAAHQLAVAEHFSWPLPTETLDACDLMHWILTWESEQAEY